MPFLLGSAYRKWGTLFDVAGAKVEIDRLTEITHNEEFWKDLEKGQVVLQSLKELKDKVSVYESLCGDYDDLLTLIDLGLEEQDETVFDECDVLFKKFCAHFEELRIKTQLSGEHDKSNAIATLHAGAGGTEACDWVEMLFRMYSKWADKQGYKLEVMDFLPGDTAGIKSITFSISGEYAYGYLKCEKGVHRLVRISPFDSTGRRHTSFASLDVMPELSDDIDVSINTEDLRVDTYRSSGAGGQHVNKTESAIRITHIPTGIVVQCQNERSQHKNRDFAMKMLRSKLYERQLSEQQEKISGIRGEIKDIAFGSQIRSYVFHPYSLVKDHRTNTEATNVQAVMDGGIDLFINAVLG